MKVRIALIVIAAIVFARVSASQEGPKTKPDRDAIQGEWRVKHFEEEGKAGPAGEFKTMVFVFANEKAVLKGDGKVVAEGKFTLDSSKAPKQLDINSGDDGNMPCIYKLEGDNLTICAPAFKVNPERPTEFKTQKGSRTMLMKLERVKK